MNRALLKKNCGEAQWLLLATVAAMYCFCWVRVWLVGLLEMGQFETVIEQFREYERLSPVPFEQLMTYSGRIAMTYDEPIVLLSMTVWAIARGSDAVSGELSRGSMEMLLAQPVSRVQVLASQALVTVLGTALLATAAYLGTVTGIATTTVRERVEPPAWRVPILGISLPNPLADDEPEYREVPMSDKVDIETFVPAAFNLFSLGFFVAGAATLLSAADRYRWRTIGLAVALYVLQMVIKIIAVANPRYLWLKKASFFTAYEPEVFVSVATKRPEDAWRILVYTDTGRLLDLGPLGYNLILLGLGTVAYIAAAIVFHRRDLPAPL